MDLMIKSHLLYQLSYRSDAVTDGIEVKSGFQASVRQFAGSDRVLAAKVRDARQFFAGK